MDEKGYICKAALFSLSCLREESKTSFDGIFKKNFQLFFTHTLLSWPFLFRLFGFFVPYVMFVLFVFFALDIILYWIEGSRLVISFSLPQYLHPINVS